MNNRPSSSRSDRAPRGPWPWILAAGPVAVVVASLATAWLAMSRADPLVEKNYYRIGLTINRTLAAMPVAAPDPDATIVIDADGAVRVRLQNATSAPSGLRLALRRPGERHGGQVDLRARDGDEWTGRLADVAPGIRIVTLESNTWRLPVTVVERLPARIRLRHADVPDASASDKGAAVSASASAQGSRR